MIYLISLIWWYLYPYGRREVIFGQLFQRFRVAYVCLSVLFDKRVSEARFDRVYEKLLDFFNDFEKEAFWVLCVSSEESREGKNELWSDVNRPA